MALQIDRSLRLPKHEYFPAVQRKSGIAIHHTAGGSARSTIEWWMQNGAHTGRPRMVGTAYVIDHDGTIFEVFEPGCWAYQFGLDWTPAGRIAFEQRFIGIEIASEGGLVESNGKLYAFDRVSPRTEKLKQQAFDFGRPYRGYRFFDRYQDAQLDALVALIDFLCHRYDIPRTIPDRFLDYYGDHLEDFQGIIGHAMVRRDKSDPAPFESMWQRIIRDCGAEWRHVSPMPRAGNPVLRSPELEQLFQHNIRQIHSMDVSAGSLVKGLLMELERRDTYIRLHHAWAGGHRVSYDFVQGVKRDVARVARALGFQTVTDSVLEVRRG